MHGLDFFLNHIIFQRLPLIWGLGLVGTLFRMRLELVLTRRIESFPNKCLMHSLSSWPVALARQCPSFLRTRAPLASTAPVVIQTKGWKEIPSDEQAAPYLLIFWSYLISRA